MKFSEFLGIKFLTEKKLNVMDFRKWCRKGEHMEAKRKTALAQLKKIYDKLDITLMEAGK